MNGTCHRIGGLTTGVLVAHAVAPKVTLPVLATTLIACEIGSLIPDIDEPNSTVGKKVSLISKVLKSLFGHRGIIHTPFFVLIISLGLWYSYNRFDFYGYKQYAFIAFIAFIAGYISHLLLDFLTPQGIMVFYPFSKEKIHILGLKGQSRDLIVSTICILIVIVFLAIRYNFVQLNYSTLGGLKDLL